jgi:DNA-binding CsgD family transcriptional regulator
MHQEKNIMKRIILFTGLAATLFAALVVVETLQRDEPFSFPAFALDMVETGLLALAFVATAFVAIEARDARRERANLLNDLSRARIEGDRWRAAARVHIDGLSRAIGDQFDAWQLSEGEADVAVLMLKGLSHKEIARVRNTGETTVRQQAVAIYRKSGLSSRAELAAFFLEDLLSPSGTTPSRRGLALVETKS